MINQRLHFTHRTRSRFTRLQQGNRVIHNIKGRARIAFARNTHSHESIGPVYTRLNGDAITDLQFMDAVIAGVMNLAIGIRCKDRRFGTKPTKNSFPVLINRIAKIDKLTGKIF